MEENQRARDFRPGIVDLGPALSGALGPQGLRLSHFIWPSTESPESREPREPPARAESPESPESREPREPRDSEPRPPRAPSNDTAA